MWRCWPLGALACVLGVACDEAPPPTRTSALFSLEPSAGLFEAPFPIAHRMRDDGTLVVADFPNPRRAQMVSRVTEALEHEPVGFGTTSGVFLPFDGPIDPSTLPDGSSSAADDSPVFLVDIDPGSATNGARVPIWLEWRDAAQTYSPPNLLALVPRPGVMLRPNTLYAAVVLDGVLDSNGVALVTPVELAGLLSGAPPAGAAASLVRGFDALRAYLEAASIAAQRVRAATVYRTGDPYASMLHARELVLAGPEPVASDLSLLLDLDTYCVIEGHVEVPLFQSGARPYTDGGGAFELVDGEPVIVGTETIRFALSIPEGRAMPPAGWPLVFYSAGQGGAYTQFVDRGTFEEQAAGVRGRGPALYFAHSGVAALGVEAPMVGPRHPTGDTSGIEFFNPVNPGAFRDNPRQAALDFTTLMRMARTLSVPAGLCPDTDAGGADHALDADRFAFYGHSTGATIGAMVLGLEEVRGGLLSGFGGSWLYNLVIKTEPIVIADVVRSLLRYSTSDEPDIFDPVLHLAQTYWEGSEPIDWARRWAIDPPAGAAPRHVLIVQGVIDGYFPPLSVATAAISGRTQPVRPIVDPSLEDALAPFGIPTLDAPAAANLDTPSGAFSSLLVQYTQPPGYDGHYVTFQLEPPKHRYRCFMESLLNAGVGTVYPPNDDPFAPCE